MPRLPIDYSKCFIYKIVCNDLSITYTYVGHSTHYVNRKQSHKQACNCITNKEYNKKLCQIMRDNGGWDNWTMVEIEKYPCLDIVEARIRERYYYDLLNADMNSVKPYITTEERLAYNNECTKHYNLLNKVAIAEQKKQHYQLNKVAIAENRKQYNLVNKDKIKEQRRLKYLEKKAHL